MPNRILKDSICTSENIDALDSWEVEVFWYRLLVQCDDFGRMDARPAILRARCYPLAMDRVSEQDIIDWLRVLQDAGLIGLYTVDGKPYLHVTTWEKHQQVRAKHSKYPAPIKDDSNGNHLIADDSKCLRESRIEYDKMTDSPLPPTPAAQPEQPTPTADTNAEFKAVIVKFETAYGIGALSGAALLDFMALWPELQNGRREWIDDAIRVGQAYKARSPAYAIGVLRNAIQENKRPGMREQPKRRGHEPEPGRYKATNLVDGNALFEKEIAAEEAAGNARLRA